MASPTSCRASSSISTAHREAIAEALRRVFPNLQAIVEKNTARVRELEGLDLRDGVVYGTIPTPLDIVEYGVTIRLDLVGGQKTGYFLDQKTNRTVIARMAAGKRVLDCFCNVGGFALHAGKAGASSVLGIDSSAAAIEAARQNAALNNLDTVQFQVANVFDSLRDAAARGEQWDIIILDPPSFAKKRSSVDRAVAGYSELNRLALKLLQPGGILVSASCTQLVHESMLLDILYREAARLKRRLRLLYRGTQAADHPVLLGMPETQYLKFLVFDVIT
jgi:23S rRNA (cytosine1962-C5)-methyltransferase